ncbi:MAG TPA: MauE/DoxX family redox-associated membrane protein [Thermoanaerobaculia bacterium]|nr:MauE/DoxX family redox-associated membrane protein [Thermoanaerobaculia bacterium]
MSMTTTSPAPALSGTGAAGASREEELRQRKSVRGLLGLAGGAFLGGVFLLAAWTKAIHPAGFVELIRSEGLDFLLPATAVAMIALALEAGLGVALILGVRRLFVLVPTALLVVFFLFLTGRNYYLWANGLAEPAVGCGCFGNLVERTPAQAFWQDLLLMVPALLLSFLAFRSPRFPTGRIVVAGLAALGAVLLAWRAPALPLDDLATRLKAGVRLENVCTGRDAERICLSTIRPQLTEGEHLVVIADLEDERWGDWIDPLNEATLSGQSVTVLSWATPEQHSAFFWQWGPSFEIVEAPEPMLVPLYRTLPRSFAVRDGVVLSTYNGLPPVMTHQTNRETSP